jgi:hypothetical protein
MTVAAYLPYFMMAGTTATFIAIIYGLQLLSPKQHGPPRPATGRSSRRSSLSADFQPNSDLMTILPLVLVPVYLVPLSIVLHLASLAKLHRDGAASA